MRAVAFLSTMGHVQKLSVLRYSQPEEFFPTCWPHCRVASPLQWDWFEVSTLRTLDATISFVKNVNPSSRSVRNRRVIHYLIWEGKTPVEVKTAYGDKAMIHTSMFKWCGEFRNSYMSFHPLLKVQNHSFSQEDHEIRVFGLSRHDFNWIYASRDKGSLSAACQCQKGTARLI